MNFKINIENTIRQASLLIKSETHTDYYRLSLEELVTNLKKVKAAHLHGNSREVLDGFFDLYVFDE